MEELYVVFEYYAGIENIICCFESRVNAEHYCILMRDFSSKLYAYKRVKFYSKSLIDSIKTGEYFNQDSKIKESEVQ